MKDLVRIAEAIFLGLPVILLISCIVILFCVVMIPVFGIVVLWMTITGKTDKLKEFLED